MNNSSCGCTLEKITISSVDLQPKIVLAFVIVALLVGATGAVGYYSVGAVDTQADGMAVNAKKLDATAEMIAAIGVQQESLLHAQLGHVEMGEQMFAEGDEAFETEGVDQFESADLSSTERRQIALMNELQDEYDGVAAEFFEAQAAGNTDLAAQKADEAADLSTELEAAAIEP